MTSRDSRLADMAKLTAGEPEWQPPMRFDLSVDGAADRLAGLLDQGVVRSVRDPLESIADELYEVKHPADRNDDAKRGRFVMSIMERGERYGEWFYFPWKESLVHYPGEDDYRTLVTQRNRNLYTSAEQEAMYDKKVAGFGLSVGSRVIESMAQAGVGNAYLIGDMDTLSPTNLNRLRATMGEVGLGKVAIAARFLSEHNPYIEQTHLHNGYDESADRQLAQFEPDVLIDAIDDVVAKARLRDYARRNRVPVVMAGDIDSTSVLDIERYDLPSERTKPFNGRISWKLFEQLVEGGIDSGDKQRALAKIAGAKYLTPRLQESIMERDKTLTGLPQLGTTASIGGAMAASLVRDIFAGRPVPSGTHSVPTRRLLGLKTGGGIMHDVRTTAKFLQYVRSLK